MWKPVVVPFQNSQPLPTLPTTDEIRACTNVLWETMASKIVTVNDDIVVKYGGVVNEWEGQAVVYLEQHVPEVPAPRLQYDDDHKFLVPFSGEPAFVAGMVCNYRALVERNNHPDYKARFYEKYLPRVLQGHRPRLTHGDVQQKNIMVTENPSRPNDQGGRSFDVVLVDWENSGWFPWDEDWSWRVQEFVQVWPAEVAIMQLIDKDLGF
ncbi:hypothetical protein BDV34DRAFT_220909 [Aspergillus parasiticus]|uniref:Aminoglycoside phosphotransferase domain-containing protein n=1 Tax=Aspergillus parasiticus TaxID=5067 RepID=A0A5N6DZG0_ASPPA|nr:hypothetical protein BDV34DRAFT_220909 [Aspergillus parasiticus]